MHISIGTMIWFIVVLLGLATTKTGAASGDSRILGGQIATIYKFPHQVWITINLDYEQCGGSIISNRHILTSAGCLSAATLQTTRVIAGTTFRENGGEMFRVAKILVHPEYHKRKGDCDVAVLVLDRPIRFSSFMRAIPRISPGDQVKVGDVLTITGWGIKPPYTINSNALQAIDVFLRDINECRALYKHKHRKFTDTMFCAGLKKEVDYIATKGDTGGPIINAKNELVGIISWGMYNLPDVFTNITSPEIRSFIDSALKQ